MQEIRLYYESIEQGSDYLLPMISEVVPKGTNIKLVKRPKKANQFSNGALSSIMSFTTPDALITGIKNGIEYPLANIEFTEAVKTEDHELQRTYGALASYLSETFYIKISGHKESEKEFGGAEYNPFSTPKILIDQFNYEGYIIADWGTVRVRKDARGDARRVPARGGREGARAHGVVAARRQDPARHPRLRPAPPPRRALDPPRASRPARAFPALPRAPAHGVNRF